MPVEEEFSIQQIRDPVAGRPEVICETREGFLLFRNRDASADGFHVDPRNCRLPRILRRAFAGDWPRFRGSSRPRPAFLGRTIQGGAER